MDDKEPPTPTSSLLVTPLMIAMIGIVSTSLAILVYNFILNTYFRRSFPAVASPSTPEPEKASGVEEKVLETIPVVPYTLEEGGLFRVDQTECAVCLGEFEEGEVVRLLPSCRHIFHVKCIDKWFFSHSSCPVCRSAIVAPVMSSDHSMSLELASVDETATTEHSSAVSVAAADHTPQGEVRPNRLLRHCASVVLVREGKVASLEGVVKRSMSLDFSYVSIKIQGENEADFSGSSWKVNAMVRKSKRLDDVGSSKRLDRVSSLLTMSCSGLRFNQSDGSNVILPH